ncbi:hypothetical protein THRCLA_03908 [Thraustotheca clavata]|uniref:SAM domain-containing protein n=1 Tax=Thraustotheca clavata TaxID=74557 RepID=A0A1W0A0T3_9STRA|nr:hypothetical protein THRCLA_03908 [Thraustotheca clavata]
MSPNAPPSSTLGAHVQLSKETIVQAYNEKTSPNPLPSSILGASFAAKTTDTTGNSPAESKVIENQTQPASELSLNPLMQKELKQTGPSSVKLVKIEQNQTKPTELQRSLNESISSEVKPQNTAFNSQSLKPTLHNQSGTSLTETQSHKPAAVPIAMPSENLKKIVLDAPVAPSKSQLDSPPSVKASTPLPPENLPLEKSLPQQPTPTAILSDKSILKQPTSTSVVNTNSSKPAPRLAGPQVTPEVAAPLNVLDDPTMKGALAEAELAKARVEQRLKIERERRHSLGSLPTSSSPIQQPAPQININAKDAPSSTPEATIKCTQCNMELCGMSLATHEQSQCRMRFDHRAKDIAAHESECSKTVIKCKHCSADIALADVAEHELQCDQILKQCPHCLRRQKMSELAEHINSCDCRLVQCPNQCGGKFLQRGLEKHVLTKCPKRATTAPPPATPPPTAPRAPPPQECKYCDESYAVSAIEAHEQECDWKPKRCQHCNMVIISRDLARHETSCKQSSRQCTHCQQSFSSASFSAHIPKCTKRPIKCIRCGELFPADIIVVHSTSCKPAFSNGEAKPVVPPPPSTPPPSQPAIISPSKRKSESNLKQFVQPDPKSSLQRHASSIQLQGPKTTEETRDKLSRRSFALAQLTAGTQLSNESDHEDEESEEDDDGDEVSLAQVVSEWNVDNVCLWLKEDVGVPDVVERFDAFQINGRALLELTEVTLISKLGIKVKAHRDRILAAIEAIKTSDEFSSEEDGSQDDGEVEQDDEDDENDTPSHHIAVSRESNISRRMSLQSMPDNSAQTQSNLLNRINSALQTGTAFRTKQK